MDLYTFGILFVDFWDSSYKVQLFPHIPHTVGNGPRAVPPMIAGATRKGQPPNYHVIASPQGVAIPWSTEHPGESTGLPEGELPEGQEKPPWGASLRSSQ